MPDVVNAQITDAVTSTVNPQITDAVNPQITDAARTASGMPSSGAPATGLGSLYQQMAEATALAFENAVNAQQQMNEAGQAATIQGVMQIYSMDTMSAGMAEGQLTQDGAAHAREVIEKVSGTKDVLAAATPPEARDATLPPSDDPAHLLHHLTAEGAAALQALNDVFMRQAIRQVELAAVAMTLARALAVDPAAPNAAEQVRMYNELLRETIATMNGWAASL